MLQRMEQLAKELEGQKVDAVLYLDRLDIMATDDVDEQVTPWDGRAHAAGACGLRAPAPARAALGPRGSQGCTACTTGGSTPRRSPALPEASVALIRPQILPKHTFSPSPFSPVTPPSPLVPLTRR